jgi:hypothetical protein
MPDFTAKDDNIALEWALSGNHPSEKSSHIRVMNLDLIEPLA